MQKLLSRLGPRGIALVIALGAVLAVMAGAAFCFVHWRSPLKQTISATLLPARPLTCPRGMAPEAWRAWMRACLRAKVSPNRITQTIGDDPRSKGYHLQDGWVREHGVWLPYSAATDIHVLGLNDAQIARLLPAMAAQGFAAWYRHGPKWVYDEHIHAVYALLPMKPQLRGQVWKFLNEQKARGRVPRWIHKLKRHYRHAHSNFSGPT